MAAVARLDVQPIDAQHSFKIRAFAALKQAIMAMDIYGAKEELRLDERRLAEDLGVSRTPIREALALLEQEGFVRSVPRRGVFVVRKTKAEILDMILVWAAVESMAARLATERASDEDLRSLRGLVGNPDGADARAHLDEYSESNIAFHQRIIQLAGSELLSKTADNLFIHMRAIRRKTIGERDRVARSIVDHMAIISALEARDAELAERLVREHSLNLARHVATNVDYLD
ncbi:MAG: GntR family transcriptional regulator [Alphaproteobacteria bacterium]|nr:GntR family transcriptional regulator [Alphaproteobacteria bacterium]